jgi:transcriptional regulator with XRE-family HTH domain
MVTLIPMKLKDLVKAALTKKGMNQTDLADRINVTPAQISRIMSGERGTSIETLVKIADALNIRHEDIFKAAAGILPANKDIDPWVEQMNIKLNSIKDPAARALAEKVLESLSTEAQVKPTPQPKKAKGHA